MQVISEEFLRQLYAKYLGCRFVILVGSVFGDSGKGKIESALEPHFEAFVRPSGGANTGRTVYLPNQSGEEKPFDFHLIPAGYAFGKLAIIGHDVLVDLDRAADEITRIQRIVGSNVGRLMISPRAPVHTPYSSLLEAWIELAKGANAVGTTKRGISTDIAFDDLRIGLRTGQLFDQKTVRDWLKLQYNILLPILQEIDSSGLIDGFALEDFAPEVVADRIIKSAEALLPFIEDIGPELHRLKRENVPTLFGLTQGFGLNRKHGTYPFSTTTQCLASNVAASTGLPMNAFGGVILITKPITTRVGAGHFVTGLWNREDAENFPLKNYELFSVLEQYIPEVREKFLEEKRQLINSGKATDVDFAQYWQVLLNNIGVTSGRGREPAWPDLYLDTCAVDINGVDALAVTQLDSFDGLDFNLRVCTGYEYNGSLVERPSMPTPIEKLQKVQPVYVDHPMHMAEMRCAEAGNESELPVPIKELIKLYEKVIGVPVGMASFSPTKDGTIFRSIE